MPKHRTPVGCWLGVIAFLSLNGCIIAYVLAGIRNIQH